MKQIILPAITEEINTSPNYAPLRQIYHSLILAEWFKRKHKHSNNVYSLSINQSYTQGLESETPWEKDTFYQQYLKSYQEGEYKLKDKLFGLNRMYFSGGVTLAKLTPPLKMKNLSLPSILLSDKSCWQQNTLRMAGRASLSFT